MHLVQSRPNGDVKLCFIIGRACHMVYNWRYSEVGLSNSAIATDPRSQGWQLTRRIPKLACTRLLRPRRLAPTGVILAKVNQHVDPVWCDCRMVKVSIQSSCPR